MKRKKHILDTYNNVREFQAIPIPDEDKARTDRLAVLENILGWVLDLPGYDLTMDKVFNGSIAAKQKVKLG